ncbi:nitroreductase family protein [Patescibacteria group bacterium]
MNLEEVINKRKSVRKFTNRDVSDELLEEIIVLARKAPSAGAIRGYSTTITREKITHVDAPVYIIIWCDKEKYSPRYGKRGKNLYAIQDATIFGAYIQLLLVEKGLDSVWVGGFREEKVKKMSNTDLFPVAIIALGYK